MADVYREVADCPHCGKRDFVKVDDNHWVCLSCKFSEKTPQVGSAFPNSFDMVLATCVALLIIVAALL